MKITTIKYSMTRQITAFHPANFEIEANITEDEDPAECARALQELVIRILYKDKALERDSLIKQLCNSDKPDVIAPAKIADPIKPITNSQANGFDDDLPF